MHNGLYGSRQLREGEAVVATYHRSPWLSLGNGLVGAVLLVGDFFLFSWWLTRGWWGVLGFFLLLIVGGILAARAYLEWANTKLIVTNQRMLAIDQQGLLTRSVAEVPMEKVQDVRFTHKGVRATFGRFATVTIEVVGGSAPVHLPGLPEPEAVQELLGRLSEERRAELSRTKPVDPLRRPRVDGVRRPV